MKNYICTSEGFLKSAGFSQDKQSFVIEYTDKIRDAQVFNTTGTLPTELFPDILKNYLLYENNLKMLQNLLTFVNPNWFNIITCHIFFIIIIINILWFLFHSHTQITTINKSSGNHMVV